MQSDWEKYIRRKEGLSSPASRSACCEDSTCSKSEGGSVGYEAVPLPPPPLSPPPLLRPPPRPPRPPPPRPRPRLPPLPRQEPPPPPRPPPPPLLLCICSD